MALSKICGDCAADKPFIDFYKKKDSKDGYRPHCKVCHSTRSRNHRILNKNKLKEQSQQYYQDNKEKIIHRSKEWSEDNKESRRRISLKWDESNRDENNKRHREYRKTVPIKEMLRRAKQRCRKSGLDFSIIASDLFIPDTCPLLGIKIDIYHENIGNHPSLDRIDSSLGYTVGNVHVVSWRANMLKNNATAEELINIGTNLQKIQEKT